MRPTMDGASPKVDAYVSDGKGWQAELGQLRAIILGCGLTEELKWDQPCYTLGGKNVLLIHRLKEACALAFLKGALLEDADGLLVKPGANTQSGRWLKFASVQEVVEKENVLRTYIHEAIEVERAGLEVAYKKTEDYPVPQELQAKLAADPALKTAFEALTPGRQRGYLLHFAAPKQSKTRVARIEKWTPQILKGRGLHDY